MMTAREKIKNYLAPLVEGKRVAILGFAREGQSTAALLNALFPKLPVTSLDKNIQGPQYLADLGAYDVIFKTPGIPSLLVPIQDAVNGGAYLTSQTDVFFSVFGSQIIAVTGTKGKSTTCSVIEQVLKSADEDVVLIGNIGRPAFDALDFISDSTKIVYETSSHQCEGLHTSPHVAVMLNLFQDHLDYYPSMDLYGEAKRQLFVHQQSSDVCVYNSDDSKVVALLSGVKAKRIAFSLAPSANAEIFVTNGHIEAFGSQLLSVEQIALLGTHNVLNVMPAIAIAMHLGIDMALVCQVLSQVKPVAKRLEVVGKVKDVTYIDDALATIPEATIAGINALGDQVATLIVGGFDRGQDFVLLADTIARSSIRSLILFPTTGEKIAKLVLLKAPSIRLYPVTSMRAAVNQAQVVTPVGKTVLLSTASASFGLFADYRDRSQQYIQAIQELE